MSFMQIETRYGLWYVVDTASGGEVIPADVVGSLPLPKGITFDPGDRLTEDSLGDKLSDAVQAALWSEFRLALRDYVGVCVLSDNEQLHEIELRESWGARYSAPGYLDCTDWVLAETEEAAEEEVREMYGEA